MAKRGAPLIFVNLGHAYDHLFMLLYPTVVLALEVAWQLPYDELLTLSVGGFVAFGVGTLPAGWLGDRWSRTGMLVVFFVGIGLSSIVTGLARSPFGIAVGLTLIGLFASIYHPVGIALVAERTSGLGRALGVNGVYGNIGVAFAALAAGGLSELAGWRAAFLVPGVIAVATGVAYAWWTRGVNGASVGGAIVDKCRPSVSRNSRVRVFAVLAIAALCSGLIFHAAIVAMPKLFDERLAGLADSALDIGALVALIYAVAAFAQIVVGQLIDRFALKPIFLAILLLQAPVLLAVGVLDGLPLVAVVLAAMVLIFGEIPIHDALVARYTAIEWRSRVYALMYALGLGVGALGVPLVVLVHGASGGFAWLFVVYAALALAIAAAVLFLPGERARAAPPLAAMERIRAQAPDIRKPRNPG